MPPLEPTPKLLLTGESDGAPVFASTPRTSPPRTRAWALSTCACLALAGVVPCPVLAAPAEAPAAQPSAEDIFRRGQAKYETADYNGAIELWTDAYSLVDSTPENASIKALIIYNLAQAHLKAYDLDQDMIHLKQALELLQRFRGNLELLYDDQAQIEEEQQNVDARISEVEDKIAMETPVEPEEPDEPDEPDPPQPEVTPPIDTDPVDAPRPGKALVITGGTLLGLGVGLGAVGVVGSVMGAGANYIEELEPDDVEGRAEQFATGRLGNGLAFIGILGAVVFVTTGAALLGVGAKRNKQAKGAGTAQLRLSPNLQPGSGGGLTLSGRF